MRVSDLNPGGLSTEPPGFAALRAFRLWSDLLDSPCGTAKERVLEAELCELVLSLSADDMGEYSRRVTKHLSTRRLRRGRTFS